MIVPFGRFDTLDEDDQVRGAARSTLNAGSTTECRKKGGVSSPKYGVEEAGLGARQSLITLDCMRTVDGAGEHAPRAAHGPGVEMDYLPLVIEARRSWSCRQRPSLSRFAPARRPGRAHASTTCPGVDREKSDEVPSLWRPPDPASARRRGQLLGLGPRVLDGLDSSVAGGRGLIVDEERHPVDAVRSGVNRRIEDLTELGVSCTVT